MGICGSTPDQAGSVASARPPNDSSGEAVLSFELPKSFFPKLIGAQGATIKRLQSSCSVRIQIPNRDDPSTTILVRGKQGGIDRAKAEIESILGFKVSDTPLVTALLDIPESFYGKIIGQKGNNLRVSEQKFACSITVPNKSSKSSVIVQGARANVDKLHAEFERTLRLKIPKKFSEMSQKSKKSSEKIDLSKGFNEILFFPDRQSSNGWQFDRFVTFLRSARRSCDVCVFTITNDIISDCLVDLFRDGVTVRIITDDGTINNKGSDIKRFVQAGIPVKRDNSSQLMHHKFAILDGKVVLNGSFNWTVAASRENYENVVIMSDKHITGQFTKQFDLLWKSKEFTNIR
eukprot:184670_1